MENIENPQNQSKNSLFKDKGALTLDRLTVEVVGREDEAGRLSDVLGSTKLGYLPKVISVFGPPGSGKTLVTHRVCSDYVHSAPDFKFVYVNLGEVRTLFSVANRLLTALGGKPLLPRAGLDGVMEEFWSVVRGMGPGVKFLLLCLDEADRLFHDRRGDPSGFMYGLVRSEDRLEGLGVHLSLLTISNMIVWDYWELDGRVRSSMGTEEILFPPYEKDDLKRIVEGGCEEAFKPGVVDGEVIEECIDYASG